MLSLNDLPDHMPIRIKIFILKCVAINIIQKESKKYLRRRYGENWKELINYKWKVEDLDYYCERHGIYDPWYDYCDDPRYDYEKSDDDIWYN